MTALADALRLAADELARCHDCGKHHEVHRNWDGSWTWASEDDGHALRDNAYVWGGGSVWPLVASMRRRADELDEAAS